MTAGMPSASPIAASAALDRAWIPAEVAQRQPAGDRKGTRQATRCRGSRAGLTSNTPAATASVPTDQQQHRPQRSGRCRRSRCRRTGRRRPRPAIRRRVAPSGAGRPAAACGRTGPSRSGSETSCAPATTRLRWRRRPRAARDATTIHHGMFDGVDAVVDESTPSSAPARTRRRRRRRHRRPPPTMPGHRAAGEHRQPDVAFARADRRQHAELREPALGDHREAGRGDERRRAAARTVLASSVRTPASTSSGRRCARRRASARRCRRSGGTRPRRRRPASSPTRSRRARREPRARTRRRGRSGSRRSRRPRVRRRRGRSCRRSRATAASATPSVTAASPSPVGARPVRRSSIGAANGPSTSVAR